MTRAILLASLILACGLAAALPTSAAVTRRCGTIQGELSDWRRRKSPASIRFSSGS